jgi:hypothetical protein
MRSARPDFVPPDSGCALGSSIISDNQKSFLVSLIYDVVNAARLIIADLYSLIV